ncbi:hypothetical protein CSIM01_07051 [Colletotrichum simmondsii]|uniref:Uncharacterized protein n=1 Tax=Colletotrichum simmondsii TaxID=703756 RepID=A0A135RT76_9PEZI|nr:hypothetical protein CSIM01_07051 [Colletotrichum simmondsii]
MPAMTTSIKIEMQCGLPLWLIARGNSKPLPSPGRTAPQRKATRRKGRPRSLHLPPVSPPTVLQLPPPPVPQLVASS